MIDIKNQIKYWKSGAIDDLETAKILIFHGRPTPEQAYAGFWGKMGFRYVKPTKWIAKFWGV